MLNFNPLGKKVILSVDGGGMRGTIPIAMLAELEEMTGRPAYELFDMVGGTSTGAIIAAGLALRLSAQELLAEVYRKRLPQAFPPDTLLGNLRTYGRFLLGGLRYLYDLEPFRLALQDFAAGKSVRELSHPIFFATTKDVRTGDTYYVVSRGPGLAAVADWPVTGAPMPERSIGRNRTSCPGIPWAVRRSQTGRDSRSIGRATLIAKALL